jgi:hypothetical protein
MVVHAGWRVDSKAKPFASIIALAPCLIYYSIRFPVRSASKIVLCIALSSDQLSWRTAPPMMLMALRRRSRENAVDPVEAAAATATVAALEHLRSVGDVCL